MMLSRSVIKKGDWCACRLCINPEPWTEEKFKTEKKQIYKVINFKGKLAAFDINIK